MSTAFSLHWGPEDLLSPIPLGPPAGALRAGLSLARAGDMSLSRQAEGPCESTRSAAVECHRGPAASAVPGRNRFLDRIGAVPERTFALHQVHSKTVLVVDDQTPEALDSVEADGMVSARPDVLLTITVADCVPIFLVDPIREAFGIVHSGWKGTGIVGEALGLMGEAFGTKPGEVSAVLGPSIGPCCYRVPRERYEKFRADFGERAVARGAGPNDYRLDLREANVDLLSRTGVSRISVCTDCTGCTGALGSFRRQGPGSFTHMLAFIGHLAEADS